MSIDLIHVSDIHFGSGESHGRLNPQTGLNIRFEDFVRALEKVVDFSIDNNVDVFLFSGDAYKNATPAPIYQKMFANQLRRLSQAGITTVLVVGNHDQLLRSSQSHAMSVFQSLEIAGVTIIDRPVYTRLETKAGPLQLIGLPHVTRHNLMTLDKYQGYTAAQLDAVLVEHVHGLLKGFYEQLDNSLPTVVTAHMSVDRAVAGIEQELLVGYTLTFPTDIFVDESVDYVALGHIHKHQIIRESSPTVIYAGSLERVDFGEAQEDKGFVRVKIDRKKVEHQFHSIGPRPFVTVETDLTDSENPTEDLILKVKKKLVDGCVLRVRYKIEQEKIKQIDEQAVLDVANQCLSVRFQLEVIPSHNRGRLPQLTESSVASPVAALSTYLDEVAPER
ncbi:MAG: exonuclease SbcCD subunit D, partial [Candidatus Obscuribacterales bacterium]|nr:exonuclease SbcCD subunit D [Candidatus Obscuribacterales bacterium]